MTQINASQRGKMPRLEEPTPFRADDGRRGWKVPFPARRPLATPAVAAGRVLLGGGFGGYEFYALDADTGRLVWQYQTTDDGPTAAVVHDGLVAFNTESCELEILSLDGRSLWKKWLGDPLMSMPALGGGRAFVAFPDSRGAPAARVPGHYLAAFALRSGRELWRQPLGGEVITAPVLADGHVYLATLDGTLCCFRQDDGRPLWQEPRDATSAPVVWRGQCYFSQRREHRVRAAAAQQMEQVAGRGPGAADPAYGFPATLAAADYLDQAKRFRRSPQDLADSWVDGTVGFAAHKGDSKMEQARRNLGRRHIAAVWAYQGSKPFVWRGRLYSALGDTLYCVDPYSRAVHWKRALFDRGGAAELLDGALTPPALVNGKAFLGTIDGRVLCLDAASGETLWAARVGEPVLFQPAVAGGRVYVPTQNGSLYCLETGDPDDDGWLMWGADAAHNGRSDDPGPPGAA